MNQKCRLRIYFHLIHHQGNKIFFLLFFSSLFHFLNKLTKKWKKMRDEGRNWLDYNKSIWVLIPSFFLSTCFATAQSTEETVANFCKWIIVRYVYNIKLHSNPRLISNSQSEMNSVVKKHLIFNYFFARSLYLQLIYAKCEI